MNSISTPFSQLRAPDAAGSVRSFGRSFSRSLATICGFLLLSAVCLPWRASAIVYSPISDADLLRGADRVVLGEVVAVEAGDADGTPTLRYRLWVEESFRGGADLKVADSPTDGLDFVDVVVPGGRRADGLAFWIPGTPRLGVGERGLFFLAGGEADAYRLHQHTLGLFRVLDIETGTRSKALAVRAIGEAAVFIAPTDGIAAKGLSRSIESRMEWPRDLDGFRSWLRAATASTKLSSAPRDADYLVDPATLGAPFAEKFTVLTSRTGSDAGACGDDGGRPVRWFAFDDPESDFTIEWRMFYDGQAGAQDDGIHAIRRALSAWQDDPYSNVRQKFAGLGSSLGGLHRSDLENNIVFEDPADEIPGRYDGSGLLALGGPWFFCTLDEFEGEEFHRIAEADVVIQNGVFDAFATTPWVDQLLTQLIAHEMGHGLGIGHTDAPQALMQPNLHLDPRGAALEPDELAALRFLYPRDPTETVEIPAVPAAPDVTPARGPRVLLSWDAVDGASNYRIERRPVPGRYEFVTTLAETSYTDGNVEPMGRYEYRLRAQTATGASAPSLAVEVVAGEDARPAAPSQLRSYAISDHRAGLRWQNNACDADRQVLVLSMGNFGVDIPTDISGDETEVLLAGLRPRASYSFQLRAENQFGSSPGSEPVVVGPLDRAEPCEIGSELCLQDRRFRVTAEYRDASDDSWRPAMSRSDDDRRGFFSFSDSGNLETEVFLSRPAAGASPASLAWTSLTGQPWRLQVVDSVSGEAWSIEPTPGICGGSAELTAAVDALAWPPPGFASSAPASGDPASINPASSLAEAASALSLLPQDASVKADDPTVPCGRAATDLYLLDGRFRARLTWWNAGGVERQGRALDLTDQAGGFEINTNDQLGWMVKILDGRGVNDAIWVFASPTRAAAAFGARLEVEDLQTGARQVYGRPAPAASDAPTCGVGDIHAFPQ